jgi:hypothetical protein
MSGQSKNLSCGLDYSAVPDIDLCLRSSSQSGFVFSFSIDLAVLPLRSRRYDFICAPVFHPRMRREMLVPNVHPERPTNLTRPDFVLTSNGENSAWLLEDLKINNRLANFRVEPSCRGQVLAVDRRRQPRR